MNTTRLIKLLAILLCAAPFARGEDEVDTGDILNRGVAKEHAGDFKGAIEEYDRAIEVAPAFSRAFFCRGNAKRELRDLDGAMSDFTRAIEFDPADALPYNNRGIIKKWRGDLDGALADYSQAIELDPKYSLAYHNRGEIKQARQDLEGAIADYDRAIALKPTYIDCFLSRGSARQAGDDLEGALADYESALQVDPGYPQAFLSRGITESIQSKWAEALADFRRFCELSEGGQDYPQIFIWLVRARLGQTEAASKDLSVYYDKRPQEAKADWRANLAGALLGTVTEEKLLAAAASEDKAKEKGQQCEAWYYLGMKKLLAGDKTAAVDAYRKCLATKQSDFMEYQLARAELKAAGEKVPQPSSKEPDATKKE